MSANSAPASNPSNRGSDRRVAGLDPASASRVVSTAVTALLVVVLACSPSRWLIFSCRQAVGDFAMYVESAPTEQVGFRLESFMPVRVHCLAVCRRGRGWWRASSWRSGGAAWCGRGLPAIARRLWENGLRR